MPMPNLALSPTGLLMAASCSFSNVMTDVARKHALDHRDPIPATFSIRVAVAAIFGLALLWRIVNGAQVVIRDGGALFGIAALRPAHIPEFLIYLAIDVLPITVHGSQPRNHRPLHSSLRTIVGRIYMNYATSWRRWHQEDARPSYNSTDWRTEAPAARSLFALEDEGDRLLVRP